jgi:hypothetical protein
VGKPPFSSPFALLFLPYRVLTLYLSTMPLTSIVSLSLPSVVLSHLFFHSCNISSVSLLIISALHFLSVLCACALHQAFAKLSLVRCFQSVSMLTGRQLERTEF